MSAVRACTLCKKGPTRLLAAITRVLCCSIFLLVRRFPSSVEAASEQLERAERGLTHKDVRVAKGRVRVICVTESLALASVPLQNVLAPLLVFFAVRREDVDFGRERIVGVVAIARVNRVDGESAKRARLEMHARPFGTDSRFAVPPGIEAALFWGRRPLWLCVPSKDPVY